MYEAAETSPILLNGCLIATGEIKAKKGLRDTLFPEFKSILQNLKKHWKNWQQPDSSSQEAPEPCGAGLSQDLNLESL